MRKIAVGCIRDIKDIDYENLMISDYNLSYIKRILPNISYYFDIYIQAILTLTKENLHQKLIIDFGGGHGFLSIFLKKLGCKVIYCDYNPLSVKTIQVIKEKLGYGPDYIVEGSSKELLAFCKQNQLTPSYLIATDLIEHVYNLDLLFQDLHQLNPSLEMVFTTGSNPKNPIKCHSLKKLMKLDEIDFFCQRKQYIEKEFPQVTQKDIDELALRTKGEIFSDIRSEVESYIKTGVYPEKNKYFYNTCDPKTGNWSERILPLQEYTKILNKFGFKFTLSSGYYNEDRKNCVLAHSVRFINTMIRHSGYIGLMIAPYISLKINQNEIKC